MRQEILMALIFLATRRRSVGMPAAPRWLEGQAPSDDEVADQIRSVPPHYATTYSLSGQMDFNASFAASASGDATGSIASALTGISVPWDVDGGTVPTVSAWVHGTVVAAAGNWLIANSDPFQGMGDAAFQPPGFTVSNTHKVKLLVIINNDTTNYVTIVNGAAAGTTLFGGTANTGIIVEPGGFNAFYDPTGALSGALTTGTNDKMTVSVSAGAPSLEVLIGYGL